jgi:hypothetical protein
LYSGVNVLRFLRAIDNSWRIIAISGASMEAGDDHSEVLWIRFGNDSPSRPSIAVQRW